MEEEKNETTSPAPEAKPEAEAKKECKCCIGNFFKNIGLGYSDHKLAYHIVGGIAVSVLALHLYTKYRGGGGHCCH